MALARNSLYETNTPAAPVAAADPYTTEQISGFYKKYLGRDLSNPGEATGWLSNPNAEAMKYINPEIAANAAVFPDPQGLKRMEMMRDLDRKQRRVLSRIWIEIKVR